MKTRWIDIPVIIFISLALLLLHAHWRFGSVAGALRFSQGYLLLVKDSPARIKHMRPGDKQKVTFTVRNLGSGPITLLGAWTGCYCNIVSGLPTNLSPEEEAEIVVEVYLPYDFRGSHCRWDARLWLDTPSKPVFLSVWCQVSHESI